MLYLGGYVAARRAHLLVNYDGHRGYFSVRLFDTSGIVPPMALALGQIAVVAFIPLHRAETLIRHGLLNACLSWYPSDSRKRCDLVVNGCWIEVKGLWPTYWEGQGKRAIYEAYLFDPLKPYPALGKSHTAARDLIKLRSLSVAEAPTVGLVLVGFDSAVAACHADVDEFACRAGLGGWWHGHAGWADPQRPGETAQDWGWFSGRR